jgi:hydroxyacylglutathione hydrolase
MLEDGFGDIIGKARTGLGITLKQMADATQLAVDRLRLLEECEVDATPEERGQLASALGLHPQALARIARNEYHPYVSQNANTAVYSCKVSAMHANAYLLTQRSDATALLVDPGGEITALLQLIEAKALKLEGILITHGHEDHTAGVESIVRRLHLPVLAHPQEYVTTTSVPLTGSGFYQIGAIRVHALHCPGHTKHSYAFMIGDALFTGDTLFAGSMGRTRSVTAYQQLLSSGRQLLALPEATVIYPGHGPVTTVEQERIGNPFLA